MKPVKKLSISEIDQGFCRIIYVLNNHGKEHYYCLQQDAKDKVSLYAFNEEPEYQTKFRSDIQIVMEMPDGNSELEILVKQWILENNYCWLDKYIK